MPWPVCSPNGRALEQQHQPARAFSSSGGGVGGGGGGETDAERGSAVAALLQVELAALNRELADVFGEQPPDGPAGGVEGLAISSSSSSSSSSSLARRPMPPPPPRRPLPPPAPPAAAAADDDARLSHVEPRTGRASMVDVSPKRPALREARASCLVRLSRRAAAAVAANSLKKGDVLGTARLAGVMAAKKTSDLIPLCHPLLLSRVDVTCELVDAGRAEGGAAAAEEEEEEEEEGEGEAEASGGSGASAVRVACLARVGAGSTGVEMEALTGASVAALTVYDMVKAVGKGCAVVTDLRLDYKVGGKGGAWARSGLEREDGRGWALMRGAAAEAAAAAAAAQGGGGD